LKGEPLVVRWTELVADALPQVDQAHAEALDPGVNLVATTEQAGHSELLRLA
jgi:hypothetical protein